MLGIYNFPNKKILNIEILVIDNASFDGTARACSKQYYPQVTVYTESNKNLGFARANNEAFRKSCGRFLLFLNPDTKIINNAVNVMVDYLQRLENIGVVGCKLLNADGTVQTSCIQSFPTIINQLLGSELMRAIWPKS